MNYKVKLLLCALHIFYVNSISPADTERSVTPVSERSGTPTSPQSLPEIPSIAPEEQHVTSQKLAKKQEPGIYSYKKYIEELVANRKHAQSYDKNVKPHDIQILVEAARAGDEKNVKKILKVSTFQETNIEVLGALARAQNISLQYTDKAHKTIVQTIHNKLDLLQNKRAKEQRKSKISSKTL